MLAAGDEPSWELAIAALEQLHAIDAAGEVEWSPYAWRAWSWSAVQIATDPIWWAALPEGPDELLARLASDPRSVAQWEVALGIESALCVRLRDVGELREALTRSVRLLERSQMAGEQRCHLWTDVARDHAALGDYAAALAALECASVELDALPSEATDPAKATVRAFDLASARMRLEIELGRPDRAALALQQARELALLISDDLSREQLWRDEADFAFASDDYDSLIERLEAERARDGISLALTERLGFAHLNAHSDDASALERARELLEQVAEHAQSNPLLRASALVGLGSLHRRAGEFDAAAQRLERARSGADAALALELAAERGALALDRGERGAELADERSELLASFEHTLARWASIPPQPDGVGFTNYIERRALLIELIRVEAAHDREHGVERALAQLLRAEALGSLARELQVQASEPEVLRAKLSAPRRGVLLFLPGPQRGCVFTLGPERIELFEIPASDRWREDQRALCSLLGAPPERERDAARRARTYAELVRRLSEQLLPPLVCAQIEAWDELTVVGLDMLGYLPFECLEVGGQELGLAKAVAYGPSLLLLDTLEERWRSRGSPRRFGLRSIAAPADPHDAAQRFGWSPIVWDGRRQRRMSELWNESARFASGTGATWSALRDDSGGELAVLEILAHGFYDSSRSPPVGIALAPDRVHDGYIGAQQIAELRAPPIVSFAVCGAARGPLRSGDEATGHLGGAALRAGASVVLLAALDIEQAPTEALLDRTYEALAGAGATTARALQQARLELSRSASHSDPYYRNLLHCVGLGHTPLVDARSARLQRAVWTAWVLAVVLTVVVGFVAARLLRSRRAAKGPSPFS